MGAQRSLAKKIASWVQMWQMHRSDHEALQFYPQHVGKMAFVANTWRLAEVEDHVDL